MIIKVLVEIVFFVIDFILGIIGSIMPAPAGMFDSIISYVNLIIQYGSGLFFFVIRPSTFYIALDVILFLHTAPLLYSFVMWVIRKIPFLNVS